MTKDKAIDILTTKIRFEKAQETIALKKGTAALALSHSETAQAYQMAVDALKNALDDATS